MLRRGNHYQQCGRFLVRRLSRACPTGSCFTLVSHHRFIGLTPRRNPAARNSRCSISLRRERNKTCNFQKSCTFRSWPINWKVHCTMSIGSRLAAAAVLVTAAAMTLGAPAASAADSPEPEVSHSETNGPSSSSSLIEVNNNNVGPIRSEEHTSELQSRGHLVCRLLLEKKNQQ